MESVAYPLPSPILKTIYYNICSDRSSISESENDTNILVPSTSRQIRPRRRAIYKILHRTVAGLDPTGIQREWKQPEGYTIPYGCLLPKNTEGLLLSGRNISGTHLAHSNFRVMPICAGIAAAAGAAAALAVQRGVGPRRVPIGEIQAALG